MTQEFKDHIVQHPNRFKRIPVAGTTDQFDLIPTWVENPNEVVQLGTPIDRQLFEGITSQLAATVKKNETGVLDLNVFDEPTRAAIQGIAPGTINAVLGDGNVKPKNLSFMPVFGEVGKNLFDKERVLVDYYINHETGELVVNNNKTFTVSDFIPVTPQTTYTRKFPQRLAFYDANKVFISGVFSNLTITTPPNASFVRFDILKVNLYDEQFEKGEISTEYEPYRFVAGKDSLKNGIITQEKMDAAFLQQLMNAGIASAMTTENQPWEVL